MKGFVMPPKTEKKDQKPDATEEKPVKKESANKTTAAQTQADEILAEAKADAEQIKETALADAEKLREEALADGHAIVTGAEERAKEMLNAAGKAMPARGTGAAGGSRDFTVFPTMLYPAGKVDAAQGKVVQDKAAEIALNRDGFYRVGQTPE
jgi:cell division septum initiation protein DivIVA